MQTTLRRLAALALTVLAATGAPAAHISESANHDMRAVEILAASDRSRIGWDEYVVDVVITNYRDGDVNDVSRYEVSLKGTDRSLVAFRDPGDEGKYLLTVDGAMWLYLPTASRPIRVTPLQRLSGNASNGDVALLSFVDDYEAELVGKEEVAGQPTFVLELTALSRRATYRSIRYWVGQDDLLPVKAEYRMSSGKVVKKAYFTDYEEVGGRHLLREEVIHDGLQEGQRTVLRFENYAPRDLPDKMFNKNYLSQL